MGIAEFIIGPACGRTRWLHPSYEEVKTAHVSGSELVFAKNV
jgi:hypothetical protein